MHSHAAMPQFISAYCLAIKHLLNNPNEENRGQNAFNVAYAYATGDGINPLLKEWLDKVNSLRGQENEFPCGFINLNYYDPQYQMGFVKHALILAFYCLLRVETEENGFDFAMRQTSMLAGDTDTNCAIVGGLVGAYIGIKSIPSEKVQKVLECDLSQGS